MGVLSRIAQHAQGGYLAALPWLSTIHTYCEEQFVSAKFTPT